MLSLERCRGEWKDEVGPLCPIERAAHGAEIKQIAADDCDSLGFESAGSLVVLVNEGADVKASLQEELRSGAAGRPCGADDEDGGLHNVNGREEAGACHHRLCIDTSSCRLVTLAELTASANAIPRRSYLFGASWPDVRRTLLMAVEQDGDPFAVMVPTAEIIRFITPPSTRLAQALFWGEYKDTFDAERSGVLEDGLVKVHLRRWLENQDAWTLARYPCSPVMQREASRLYKSLQLYQINSTSLISEPDGKTLPS